MVSLPKDERRRSTRLECCYQVVCQQDGLEFPGTIVDMGLGGMRLLLDRAVSEGSLLAVRQPGVELGSVTVRCLWCRQSWGQESLEVGTVYQDSPQQLETSWTKSALQRLGFDSLPGRERRRFVRVKVSLEVRLVSDQRAYPCTLVDLGLGGALAELEEHLAPGTPLRLEIALPGLEPLACGVVYCHPGNSASTWRCGLRFDGDRLTQAQARLVEGYLLAMG